MVLVKLRWKRRLKPLRERLDDVHDALSAAVAEVGSTLTNVPEGLARCRLQEARARLLVAATSVDDAGILAGLKKSSGTNVTGT